MMTMSPIFLVHTISLLLLLEPTLHAEKNSQNGDEESFMSISSMDEIYTRSPNKTNVPHLRRLDGHNFELSMMTSTRPTRGNAHRHSPGTLDLGVSYTPSFHYLPPSPSVSASLSSSSAQSQSQSTRMSRRAVNNNSDGKGGGGGGKERDKKDEENHGEPLEPLYLPSSTRIIGPYFESNRTRITVTARAGQMVLFDCPVVLLQGRTVSWLRRVNDNLQLLTVGNTTYGTQSRFGLHFRYPNNWRLGILNVNKRDEGIYECQLSTHPPKALVFHLKVIAPHISILDENGNAITERHYKVDSSLHLTCKASHLDKLLDHIGWFKGDHSLPGSDSRIKVKLWKNSTNGEASAFLSVLSVRKGDSGNYTCRGSPLASNTISVHVLNGELPAAVQHENSANVLLGSCFLQSACSYAIAAILLLLISPSHASPCLLHMPNSASTLPTTIQLKP